MALHDHDRERIENARSSSLANVHSGITRRSLLRAAVIGSGLALAGIRPAHTADQPAVHLPFERGYRPLVAFPQKRPLMLMTIRPPQLETPFHLFNDRIFTPNDAFFVRWHLANIPTTVDPATFRLRVHGHVERSLTLSLADLRTQFEEVELAAVCQCAGNSRGFFEPRVPGGQWGHGAMGNARWTGVRLRDILDRAGVKPGAVQVRFDGLDRPVAEGTPDFRKSLNVEDVMNEHVLLAYAMNGEPLPLLNGFPLRLVVPGWYATYWVKMLNDIEVLNTADEGFWMTHAYRLPADPCRCIEPGQRPARTVPIGRMPVRSFITNLDRGARIPSGKPFVVKGIAFDQGYGIDRVLFSTDGGTHWQRATLGHDYGDFSFRQWKARFVPKTGHTYALQCLAINRIGESQRFSARWNPGGYLRHAVETVQVEAM
ncbi:MAG: sulfide dehydrogenase [Nitrospirae bacterium]|nr:MAG: sulfide dehydrogenase [Nitrospirota bacterium]